MRKKHFTRKLFTVLFILSILPVSNVMLMNVYTSVTASPAKPDMISVTYQFDESEILNWLDTDQYMKDNRIQAIPGEPLVPYRTAKILLPPSAEVADVSVQMKLGGKRFVKDIPCGQPPAVIGEEPKTVEKNPAIYDSNELYPGETYRVGSVNSFRGYNILHVRLYPVQYKPASKLATYYTEMTVYVTSKTGNRMDTFRNLVGDRKIVASLVDNPSTLSTYDSTLVTTETLGTTYEYIVVTIADLSDEFQVLADWKANFVDGAKVVTVNVGASDVDIKNVINDYYTNYGTSYVLLGGDVGVITDHTKYVRTSAYHANISEDYWYANLVGDDDISYYEVYIGRAPVDNGMEATHFVNKVIAYEQMDRPKANLFHQSRLCSGNDPDSRELAWQCEQYVPDDYTNYEIFEENGRIEKTDWVNFWRNDGIMCEHIGHGSTKSYYINYGVGGRVEWKNSDVPSLNNMFWPVHTSIACYCGEFEKEDCLAEAYVKDDHGAIASLMNDKFGFYDYDDATRYSGDFVEMQFKALYQDGWTSIGAMLAHSKHYFIDEANNDPFREYWEWCYREINLIGDPETRLLANVHNIDTGLDYPTIQRAIDASETLNGHTIKVDAGIYHENVVVDKSLTLIGEDPNTTIIDGEGTGNIVTVQANNVKISDFNITNGAIGIYMNNSDDSTLSDNLISNNGQGIYIDKSDDNTIKDNRLSNNNIGINLTRSDKNIFYHNSFINNVASQVELSHSLKNTWDDGYPSGGNYWSDYTGQDQDGDGIGDTPYDIDRKNKDNYPLIHPWGSIRNVDTDLIYLTIQKAIDALETLNGHTIEVKADTYYENVVVDKSLTLIGEDPSTTIIDGEGTGNIVTVQANNVRICQFMIQNGQYGIRADSNNTVISSNTVSNNGYYGVFLENCENASVIDNTVTNSDSIAVRLIYCNNVSVSGNTVSNNTGNGIFLYRSINAIVSSNMISNNTDFISAIGIMINNNMPGLGVGNSTVVDNIVVDNYEGIRVHSSRDNVIIGNIVANNTHDGIYLESSRYNSVTENWVSNNGMGYYWGIHLYASLYNIIYHNNFINNTNQARAITSLPNTWDDGYPSGGNYWSDYTGQDQDGDGIGDTPYVIAGENNQDNYPLIRPWGSIRNVDTDRIYLTIQKAIDAYETLNGHTIEVKADTYYENVVVDKSLTIIGEDPSTTIIDGGGGGMFGEDVVTLEFGNVSVSGFTIQNGRYGIQPYLTIYGSTISGNTISNNFAGVHFDQYTEDNTVSNNIVLNNDIGIIVEFSDGNTVSDNTLLNDGIMLGGSDGNTISNNIVSDGDNIYLTNSHGNTVRGNNVTGSSYGIYLRYSSGNTVSDNTASNNSYYGIYLEESSGNNISGNIVSSNSNRGIYLTGSSGNTINDNEISNNDYGIYLYSSSSNVIHHNNFINNTVQASCQSSSNTWNSYNHVGNYWSDYTGPDENPYYGIGDTSYVIDQNNQDNYPLMWKWFPGDIDGDGNVDMDDFDLWQEAWGAYDGDPDYNPIADLSYDGFIDFDDFFIMSRKLRDVAVTNVTATPTQVITGDSVSINVTVVNETPSFESSFNVTAYYFNETFTATIGTQTARLLGYDETTLTFVWNTTGVKEGNYTIKAVADTVPEETDIDDNTYVDGIVEIICWISPTGYNDPDGGWSSETNAYDDDEDTYATTAILSGDSWSTFLYLTHSTITCDKVRVLNKYSPSVCYYDIDVYRDGAWVNVYEGLIGSTWKEISFAEGTVMQMRVRVRRQGGTVAYILRLYEADFGIVS